MFNGVRCFKVIPCFVVQTHEDLGLVTGVLGVDHFRQQEALELWALERNLKLVKLLNFENQICVHISNVCKGQVSITIESRV